MPDLPAFMQFDNLTSKQFLAEYWQRRWCYCPAALNDYKCPVNADELAGLALEEDVESRVVRHTKKGYELQHGPFTEETFTTKHAFPWTLLVQAVDLWIPQTADLFDHFDFLPRWRMDDIMVSYATPGGGVGPHFDFYDVFLVQVEGTRTWRIGQWCNAETALVPDVDLKLLTQFETETEVQTNPGDVLYIPPRLAHWGIAETESVTCSVGFRAPTIAELLDDLAMHVMENDTDTYYLDPALTPAMADARIDPAFVGQLRMLLRQAIDDEALLADWFARYVTSPKYPDLVDQTREQRHALINGLTYINGQRVNDKT